MHATLSQLAAALDGARLVPGAFDVALTGVSTDSRNAPAGALFVALRGETFDGHDFLAQVAARGVAAVVVEKLPDGWTLPAIVVPDTLVALGQVARFWRRQFALPVIGVTGSNGKTTVKEMLASILAAAFGEEGRLATRGNLNNEIGVPLTLFRLDAPHQAAVIEMGMNHPGEIARLTAIAEPTVALVNNAQREHQEFMHTVEAVARENGAVLKGLPKSGVAVFPGDEEFSGLWRSMAPRRCITFGMNANDNVSCVCRAGEFGSELAVTVRAMDMADEEFTIRLQAAGMHNVRNALAAIACALAAGISRHAIVHGLEAFEPVTGRLQKKLARCGATVIDDSYNANPDSVRAAIDVLAQARSPRILVLGDMGEVGTQGPQFHDEIGAYANSRGIDQLFAIGELARNLGGADRAQLVRHFERIEDLLAALDTQLGGNSDATVLVKGSRFMKMERVVQHLLGIEPTGKDAH